MRYILVVHWSNKNQPHHGKLRGQKQLTSYLDLGARTSENQERMDVQTPVLYCFGVCVGDNTYRQVSSGYRKLVSVKKLSMVVVICWHVWQVDCAMNDCCDNRNYVSALYQLLADFSILADFPSSSSHVYCQKSVDVHLWTSLNVEGSKHLSE